MPGGIHARGDHVTARHTRRNMPERAVGPIASVSSCSRGSDRATLRGNQASALMGPVSNKCSSVGHHAVMAGGMNKRGSWGSMTDRIAASRSQESVPEAPQAPPIKHCWVSDRHGRLPALLLEWRELEGAWRGRVVRAVNEGDGWVVVEEWLPADLLDPADYGV